MSAPTAERLAQLCYDQGLIDNQQLDSVWSELGKKDVELEYFTNLLLRKELLTNWQLERLLEGKRDGFYYGDYKILYLVGTGTFSRVYRAAHKETEAVRAVKVLRQRYSDNIATTESFLQEAKLAMPLRHPNVVPTYEVMSDRGRQFMAMEFVEGTNLRDFVRARDYMELGESLRIMKDVLNGLSYAHSQGVSHRDIKLSNVLITGRGRAKLVDFGLATMINAETDKDFANAANPRSIDYAGLERATKVKRGDSRSDVFFVGCMFYHMMAGQPPLAETRDRIKRLNAARYRDIAPLVKWVPNLPNNVSAMINKAVEFNPERRYQDVVDFLNDLKRVLEAVKDDRLHRPEVEVKEDQPIEILEGDGKTILIVESRTEVQNLMRDRLKQHGYRVLVTGNPQRAAVQLEDPESKVDCLIVCTAEVGRDGLDLFNAAGKVPELSDMSAVLLFEKAQQHLSKDAQLGNKRGMIQMPVRIKVLRQALLQLIK